MSKKHCSGNCCHGKCDESYTYWQLRDKDGNVLFEAPIMDMIDTFIVENYYESDNISIMSLSLFEITAKERLVPLLIEG